MSPPESSALGLIDDEIQYAGVSGFLRWRTTLERVAFEHFTIDGHRLKDVVAARCGPESQVPGDEVTWLTASALGVTAEAVRRLLGRAPGDFDDGRVSLMVCPVDFDLGCAALSARVVVDADRVEWRDLGWQVSHEPFAADDVIDPSLVLSFERAPYESLLIEASARYLV